MPSTSHRPSCRSLIAALCLGLISGCGTEDAGFHGYSDPAPAEAPQVATPAPPTPDTGIVPASAETIQPLPAVVEPVPQEPVPAPGETALVFTNPELFVPASPELAPSIPPAPPAAVSLLPARQLELLIPEKTFHVEGPDGALRVSFDDVDLLKVLNAEPVPVDVEQHLPGWLSGLNGKVVRIRGWMFPPDFERGIRGFLFVRDNQICCFGRQALVYDKFLVRMRDGETTDYILGRPFDVVGRMVVKSRVSNGELLWLYRIEDAVVIDK